MSAPIARRLAASAAYSNQALYRDALTGLSQPNKQLPSKYFYDALGSALFEEICLQPEYYLTRAELALMQEHVTEIAALLGTRVLLIEYGCGSGLKTRLLLGALDEPVAYVPVEISPAALRQLATALAADLPAIPVRSLAQDFTEPLKLPQPSDSRARRVVYFPGSTIGNFAESEAVRLLAKMRREIGEHGIALVGIDLKKDVATLEAAYNDAAGVTREFTLNLLARLNRELDADFDLERFAHRACWNEADSRIDTHIVSLVAQRVRVADRVFDFAADEAMLVEHSCKYSHEYFAALAARAGLRVERRWVDPQKLFSVQALVAARA